MSKHPFLPQAGALLALLLTPCAIAQTPPQKPKHDPLDAQAAAPAANYRSALATYRSNLNVTPTPWAEANQTVNRIGGWRVYAREPAAPAPAPVQVVPAPAAAPTPATAAPPPAQRGHGGHSGHGR